MQTTGNLFAPSPSEMVTSLALLALLISVPVYLIYRFLRAYERRGARGPDSTSTVAVDARLAAIESQLSDLRAQMDRLEATRQAPSSFTPQPSSAPNAPTTSGGDASRFAPPTPFGRTPT